MDPREPHPWWQAAVCRCTHPVSVSTLSPARDTIGTRPKNVRMRGRGSAQKTAIEGVFVAPQRTHDMRKNTAPEVRGDLEEQTSMERGRHLRLLPPPAQRTQRRSFAGAGQGFGAAPDPSRDRSRFAPDQRCFLGGTGLIVARRITTIGNVPPFRTRSRSWPAPAQTSRKLARCRGLFPSLSNINHRSALSAVAFPRLFCSFFQHVRHHAKRVPIIPRIAVASGLRECDSELPSFLFEPAGLIARSMQLRKLEEPSAKRFVSWREIVTPPQSPQRTSCDLPAQRTSI
jgi:hypothetical protein